MDPTDIIIEYNFYIKSREPEKKWAFLTVTGQAELSKK